MIMISLSNIHYCLNPARGSKSDLVLNTIHFNHHYLDPEILKFMILITDKIIESMIMASRAQSGQEIRALIRLTASGT